MESTAQELFTYGYSFELITFVIVFFFKTKDSLITKFPADLGTIRNAKTSLIIIGLLYLNVFFEWMVVVLAVVVRL